jgi:hypothetical protein
VGLANELVVRNWTSKEVIVVGEKWLQCIAAAGCSSIYRQKRLQFAAKEKYKLGGQGN